MAILNIAREAKHLGWVAQRRARTAAVRAWDSALRVYADHSRYTFNIEKHRDRYGAFPRQYFLHRPAPASALPGPAPERRVFCFWTGTNPLSEGRQRGLHQMHEQLGVSVVLVTPDTLDEWVLPGHPLHPMYPNLSYVHRSDYLRAYFMAHHGGGYSDIKAPTASWEECWDPFDDPDVWAVGYRERSSRACGGDDHTRLGHDIHRNFARLIGLGAFIMRPGTPLAWEWLREIERRLDYYSGELIDAPGGVWGDAPSYPMRWIEIGSDVYHPTQLKYLAHIRQDDRVLPELSGHR